MRIGEGNIERNKEKKEKKRGREYRKKEIKKGKGQREGERKIQDFFLGFSGFRRPKVKVCLLDKGYSSRGMDSFSFCLFLP